MNLFKYHYHEILIFLLSCILIFYTGRQFVGNYFGIIFIGVYINFYLLLPIVWKALDNILPNKTSMITYILIILFYTLLLIGQKYNGIVLSMGTLIGILLWCVFTLFTLFIPSVSDSLILIKKPTIVILRLLFIVMLCFYYISTMRIINTNLDYAFSDIWPQFIANVMLLFSIHFAKNTPKRIHSNNLVVWRMIWGAAATYIMMNIFCSYWMTAYAQMNNLPVTLFYVISQDVLCKLHLCTLYY